MTKIKLDETEATEKEEKQKIFKTNKTVKIEDNRVKLIFEF